MNRFINFENSGLTSNVGLLDARNTGRIFYGLRQDLFPVDLFDMFSIIEEICLREKIILVGKWDKIPKTYRDAIQMFVDAKVFDLVIESTLLRRVPDPSARIMSAASKVSGTSLTSATTVDASYAVTRLLGAEISLNVPALPLLGYLQHHALMRRPEVDNAVCDLAAQYGDLRTLVEEEVRHHAHRVGLNHISVPPIALEILKSCHSIDQVVCKTLEMRCKFSELRHEMNCLSAILADPSLCTEKFNNLTQDWHTRWLELTKSTVPSRMSFGISNSTLLSGGNELRSALDSSNYFAAVMSGLKLLKNCRDSLRGRLFRPVRTPVRNYLRTSRRETCAIVGRIFDVGPKRAEYVMGLVDNSDNNVWRMQCETIRPSNTRER